MARSDRVVRLFVAAGVLAALAWWLPPGAIWMLTLALLTIEWICAWVQGDGKITLHLAGVSAIVVAVAGVGSRVQSASWRLACASCRSHWTLTHWHIALPLGLGDPRIVRLRTDTTTTAIAREVLPSSHRHEWYVTWSDAHEVFGLVGQAGRDSPRDESGGNPLVRALESDPQIRRAARRRLERRSLTPRELERLLSVVESHKIMSHLAMREVRLFLADLQREAAAGG